MSLFNTLIKSHPLILVDFYTDWCGPCKAMAPELKKLKDEMGDRIKIIKIDTEKHQRLAAKFNIRSIPTIQIYKQGKIVKQQAGGLQLTQLRQLINEYK